MADPLAYTTLQKRLHWAVAVLILLQFVVFDGMGRPLHQLLDTGVAPYTWVTIGHIASGLLILALAFWRVALRLRHGAPQPPAEEPEIARRAAKAAHVAIYALILGLPFSGLAAWFLPSHDVAEVHEIGTSVLLTLVVLHIAAVAAHQFWWKTGLLRRMT